MSRPGHNHVAPEDDVNLGETDLRVGECTAVRYNNNNSDNNSNSIDSNNKMIIIRINVTDNDECK